MELITTCCRSRLTPADATFLISTLSASTNDATILERLLVDGDMLDRLLDHPALFRALLEHPGQLPISPRLFFYVVVRHVLKDAGLDDRELADYVASVLDTFSDADKAFPTSPTGQRTPLYVCDVMEKIAQANHTERFLLTVQLANQALFFSGIFPEHIRYRARRHAAPDLEFYDSVGTAQFRAAGGHRLAHEFQLDHVFALLGQSFTRARQALNTCAERLLFFTHAPEPTLLHN